MNNKIDEINKRIYKDDLEPEWSKQLIIEKQKNKTESEKLQDKFDQMSKINGYAKYENATNVSFIRITA